MIHVISNRGIGDPQTANRDTQEIKNLKKEFEDFKIQAALAQAETFEKFEKDKLDLMQAMAETFESSLDEEGNK